MFVCMVTVIQWMSTGFFLFLAVHLIPLRAFSKGSLKVEPGSLGQWVGVHASACRGRGEILHRPNVTEFREASGLRRVHHGFSPEGRPPGRWGPNHVTG